MLLVPSDLFSSQLHPTQQLFTLDSKEKAAHYLATLKDIFEKSFAFDYTGIIEPELASLRAGLILTELVNRLDPTVPPEDTTRKLTLFTTHDTLLFYLLDALGLRPEKTVKFGTTLLFESTRSPANANEILVSVFLVDAKKPTDQFAVKQLHLPVQGSSAHQGTSNSGQVTLEAIKRTYSHLMIKDLDEWRAKCDNKQGIAEDSKLHVIKSNEEL